MSKYLWRMMVLAGLVPLTSRAQQAYRFDFGTGATEPGYRQVTALSRYNEEAGYGFDYGTQAIALDRGGNDALHSDLCTSEGPLFFSVKVPEGTYRVTVTLGDPWRPTQTTIKAESRRLMEKEVITRAGSYREVTFLVSVWDSLISGTRAVRIKPREIDKLDWDNKLTLEFGNHHPAIEAITIAQAPKAVTVFLAGNSTVTNQQLEPWASWGQMIPALFKPGTVAVANHAASGSTLRASLGRGRLDKIMQLIKPGDYLFIEFAHNDQKPGSGEEAFTTYNQYLKRYIDSAKAHEATPVLVTSTCRRSFDASGKLIPTLGKFPDAMRYEAKKDSVALLDLNQMTRVLYETLGPEQSRKLFVQFPKGTFPGQDKELADNTHFSDFGAYELARCVAQAISSSSLPLKQYLREADAHFSPEHPDDFKQWNLPLTPMYTSVKPYGN